MATYIHEKTHIYANNSIDKVATIETRVNGFSTVTTNDDVKSTATRFNGINEGFTEYTARRACDGIVDYSNLPKKGAYNDEVQSIKTIIKLIAERTAKSEDQIELELLRVYSGNNSGAVIADYLETNLANPGLINTYRDQR